MRPNRPPADLSKILNLTLSYKTLHSNGAAATSWPCRIQGCGFAHNGRLCGDAYQLRRRHHEAADEQVQEEGRHPRDEEVRVEPLNPPDPVPDPHRGQVKVSVVCAVLMSAARAGVGGWGTMNADSMTRQGNLSWYPHAMVKPLKTK
jgi:ferric-dicitrate binding protein FerR (iron transport regulator)